MLRNLDRMKHGLTEWAIKEGIVPPEDIVQVEDLP